MWLRIPTAYNAVNAKNEGVSHLRQCAIAPVRPARMTDQIGSKSSECVRLRCQVIISIGLLEKNSRKTSESGKIAPIINAQVDQPLFSDRRRREQIASAKSGFAD